jgi:hypothetical protein
MSKEKSLKFVDISVKIKKSISEVANDNALEKFVNKLTDLEVAKRAELLEKGYNLWKTTENELKKCNPDVINHVPVAGDDGEYVEQKSFSNAKFQEKTALKKRSADLEVALMQALGENQDYSKLEELIKKNPVKEKGNDKNKPQTEE